MANVERNRTFIRRWIEALVGRTNRKSLPSRTHSVLPDDLLNDVLSLDSPLRKGKQQRAAEVARTAWFKYGVGDW